MIEQRPAELFGADASEERASFEAHVRRDARVAAASEPPLLPPDARFPNVHVLEPRPTTAALSSPPVPLSTPEGRSRQLARDVEAIERARDDLLNADGSVAEVRAGQVITLPLRRTSDSVPVVLGSLLGVLMIVVFSAAAAFIKLAR